MKKLLFTLGFLMLLSSSVYATFQCPDAHLIEEKVNKFNNVEEGDITLDSRKWSFNSNLTTSEINFIKSLNPESSDIDDNICNYLIYLKDSKKENASLTLRKIP